MLRVLYFFTLDGVEIEIKLDSAITAVTAEGNVGKTYVFNALQAYKNSNVLAKLPFNYFLINDCNVTDCAFIPSLKDTLIVIDNWDVVKEAYPQVQTMLNTQHYQCLVFGRDLDGLRINRDYLLRLRQKGNKIYSTSIFSW